MGRRKAAENCEVRPWLSARADNREKRFVLIGNSLFFSEAFQALSAGAKHLYLCFTLECGGKRAFVFPHAAAKKYGIPSRSFERYLTELESAGFITKSSGWNTRTPNEYEFSFSWKVRPP